MAIVPNKDGQDIKPDLHLTSPRRYVFASSFVFNATAAEPPAAGELRMNVNNTVVYVSYINADGLDVKNLFWPQIIMNRGFNIKAPGVRQTYMITNAPQDLTTYIRFGVYPTFQSAALPVGRIDVGIHK